MFVKAKVSDPLKFLDYYTKIKYYITFIIKKKIYYNLRVMFLN